MGRDGAKFKLESDKAKKLFEKWSSGVSKLRELSWTTAPYSDGASSMDYLTEKKLDTRGYVGDSEE